MPSWTHATASTLIVSLFAITTVATPVPTSAKEEVYPAAYPELAPQALLPAILAELRHTLPDIYSVREMRLCPAAHIKLKDGKPADWAVRFEYNAKNQSGGFFGIQRDVAIFRNSHIAFPIGQASQLGRDGLDGVFSKTVDKQMAVCSAVPDATIQQILATSR